jgi:hypothetical protein
MAHRIIDGLPAMTDASSVISEGLLPSMEARNTIVSQEIQRRTVWACFIMDRTISFGKNGSSNHDLATKNLYLPSTQDDFDLGVPAWRSVTYEQLTSEADEIIGRVFSIADSSTIVIRSVDIWSSVYTWITNGGRRQVAALGTCPWEPSSTWSKINNRLYQWRNMLHCRLKYPETPLSLYVHRRQGEIFSFINLIHYLR